jgi:hypothetical protein
MRRLQFYLKLNQIKQLKAISKATGAPVAELVRRALDEFISKSKEKREHGKDKQEG